MVTHGSSHPTVRIFLPGQTRNARAAVAADTGPCRGQDSEALTAWR